MVPQLRLVSNTSDTVPGDANAPKSRPGNGAGRKPTLLIVEDEVLVRLSVADYLRANNYRVLEASNAEEAMTIVDAGAPVECVFSDIDMPGKMNGFEFARWMRRGYPDVGVLLTSGVKEIASLRGYGAENGPILYKPYALDVLLAHIKRLLLH